MTKPMPIFQLLIEFVIGLLTFRIPLKSNCVAALDLKTAQKAPNKQKHQTSSNKTTH